MTSSGGRPRSRDACFEKALDLLSRRPHFRRELENKLLMREFDPTEVASTLDRAAERGFLDDLECARSLARTRVERRAEGPAKLLATLRRRGSDADIARRVVDECFADGEAAPLRAAATKWLRLHRWDRDRLARHLGRKGFSTSAILAGLDGLRPEDETTAGSEDGG